MNTIGRKNMVFGFAYLVATLGLGMFLANKLTSGDKEWFANPGRELLRSVHAHGNLESLLNIVVGYIICRLAISHRLAQAISIIFIVGATLHSGMLYLGGLGMRWAFSATPVGAVALVLGVILMIYASATGIKKS
ncbi:MAG: hypothetical protein A2V83_04080 [Nitrospirae bacterium RBG_16_64_22]|nr:MAG: hypothetical protein A2V83_04080 [Nitrospirae bacterium RBG_16_64_22]